MPRVVIKSLEKPIIIVGERVGKHCVDLNIEGKPLSREWFSLNVHREAQALAFGSGVVYLARTNKRLQYNTYIHT